MREGFRFKGALTPFFALAGLRAPSNFRAQKKAPETQVLGAGATCTGAWCAGVASGDAPIQRLNHRRE
jgi:hypothetical protein